MSAAEEACQLAKNLARTLGWPVFPCTSSKAPAIPKAKGGAGFKDAATDPDAIDELWRRGPGELIGVPTGLRSGFDVLDIDVKHESAVRWLTGAWSKIPDTRAYKTRSGGLHLFFRHAQGVQNTESKLAAGVDTRGEGGYVIFWFAAGFDCVCQEVIGDWPDWLLTALLWEKPKPGFVPVQTAKFADKSVERIVRTVSDAQEGKRNAILFWGACRLSEHIQAGQLGKGEATNLLITAAQTAGLDVSEAKRTVANALRAA